MQTFSPSLPYTLLTLSLSAVFLWCMRKEISQMLHAYAVPFIPTSDKKIEIITNEIELVPGEHFLDIGCGDGKILAALEKKYIHAENIHFFGIENSPEPYKLALKNKKEHGYRFTVIKNNFFKEDFSNYDVIYSYTISYLMPRIWKKIQAECKPGTRFYSNSFTVPGVKPEKKIQTSKNNYLYLYIVPDEQ